MVPPSGGGATTCVRTGVTLLGQSDDEPFPEAEVAALGKMDLVAILGPEESIILAQVYENHPGQQTLGVYVLASIGTSKDLAAQAPHIIPR